MVDIENRVYTAVATALRTKFGNSFNVSGLRTDTPASLPCVQFLETDNYPDKSAIVGSGAQEYAFLRYEADIYADGASRKSDCRAIAKVIDDTLSGLNFSKSYLSPVVNADANIYRMKAAWTVEATDSGILFRT